MNEQDSVTQESKHKREGFSAVLNGWCDAGMHEIKEGDLIIEVGFWPGFVHVSCL